MCIYLVRYSDIITDCCEYSGSIKGSGFLGTCRNISFSRMTLFHRVKIQLNEVCLYIKNNFPVSGTLNVEAVSSSERPAAACRATHRHVLELLSTRDPISFHNAI
jgi:hypothetical protein